MNLSLNLNPFFAKKVNPFSIKSEPILQNEPIRILYPFRRLLTNKSNRIFAVAFIFFREKGFASSLPSSGARGADMRAKPSRKACFPARRRSLLRGGSSQDEHRCKAPRLRSRLAPQGVYFKSFLSAMQINDIINRLYSYQNQLFLYFLLPSIDKHPYFCYNYVSNSLQIHTERT